VNPEFDYAFNYLLGDEGDKFTDDPNDSGGATKFGITQKSFAAYSGKPISVEDVKNLTVVQAQIFYYEEYWRKMCCNRMTNVGSAIAVFDSGVLYGANTASKMAQAAISTMSGAPLKLDGIIGDTTLGYLNLTSDKAFLPEFVKWVLEHINQVITKNPKNEAYRAGWTKRANRLLTLVSAQNEINSEPKT
jgi:lysozyme family protein